MPVSRMFPGVDQSFVAGLRGALSAAGVEYELLIEPVGNAAVKDHVVDRIQRLLLQSPDVVTAILGAGLSRHVHGFFSDAEVPLIINDLGADPVMTGGVRNPFVFSNTLNVWQSMYALGYWASQHLGRRACVAAALHEAGYGMVQAFWLGFCEAGGGTVVATEVTHRDSADDDPADHVRRLAAHDPDVVMAFYSGREGVSFANAWSALGLAGRISLLSSPLMTHDVWLPRLPPDVLDGMCTAFAWDTGAHPAARDAFRASANVRAGHDPAVFALLGYETGLVLAAAIARRGGSTTHPGWLREGLSGAAFRSPRGSMCVDEATGETRTPDVLQAIRRTSGGSISRTSLGPLSLPPSFRSHYDAAQRTDARCGWLNPYLVT